MIKFFRVGLAVSLLGVAGCGSQATQATIPSPSPVIQPPAAPIVAKATPKADRFWDGVDKGAGAASFAQTVQTPGDWSLVAANYQTSITLLKTVPVGSPNYSTAQSLIKRHQQNVIDAQKMAAGQLKTPPASLLDNSAPAAPSEPKPAKVPAAVPVAVPAATVPSPSPSPSVEPSPQNIRRSYSPRPVRVRARRSRR